MAKRITIAYIIIGCLWVFIGDFRLEEFAQKNNLTATQVFYFTVIKGLSFVLLSGLALFLYSNYSFKKLSKLEKQYRHLFEKNPNPMWVYDLKTLKFLAINKAALKTYAYADDEWLGMTILDIRPTTERQIVIENIKTLNDDIANNGVFTHKKKNGELFYVNIYSAPTIFGNQKARMVLALDVSEKALAQQEIIKLSLDLGNFKRRLNEILSSVNDVVWACTANNYKMLFISSACQKVSGYSPAEFYADSNLWFKRVHPDDKEKMTNAIAELQHNGSAETEYRVIDKQGQIKIVLDKSSLSYDEQGNPKEIHGVATDITGLRESEQKFLSYTLHIAKILDAITDGFITLDKEWRFTYINKVFQKITNKSTDELLGKQIWQLYPQLIETPFYNYLTNAAQNQEPKNFETQYFNQKKWYVCNVYPNPAGLAIYFADVTETRLMHNEIVTTKNNLKALINTTSDLIWSIDKNKKIISANKAFINFTEINFNTKIVEGATALPNKMDAAIYNNWQIYYLRGLNGEAFSIEYPYNDANEKQTWLEIYFNPITSAEEITGISCFARDITERKNYELNIEQQNKKLREIAWMQSHEVRAPLSTIMALVGLFNHTNPADPENRELLRLIVVSTNKLDKIIHEIVNKTYNAQELNNFVTTPVENT